MGDQRHQQSPAQTEPAERECGEYSMSGLKNPDACKMIDEIIQQQQRRQKPAC